jgi:hypothetical protein
MMDYDNNMSGALFKNKEVKSERSPLYSGSCEIEGVEYWISSWIKTSKKGTRFMSLAFTAKEEKSRETIQEYRSKTGSDIGIGTDPDDEMPF